MVEAKAPPWDSHVPGCEIRAKQALELENTNSQFPPGKAGVALIRC